MFLHNFVNFLLTKRSPCIHGNFYFRVFYRFIPRNHIFFQNKYIINNNKFENLSRGPTVILWLNRYIRCRRARSDSLRKMFGKNGSVAEYILYSEIHRSPRATRLVRAAEKGMPMLGWIPRGLAASWFPNVNLYLCTGKRKKKGRWKRTTSGRQCKSRGSHG